MEEVIFSVWFLIGAILVFFMQAGFAMVETGFTRAKNAGNIIMKNLMDFCIGTVMFVAIGFSLMMSENYLFGVIGVPDLMIFTNFNEFPFSSFVFNLVFCATAATIVSGAMAERTKFSAYCLYSAVISAVVYPIEAGWVWNAQGWLCKMGFIDFAGSAVIHMVGGCAAFIGAKILGPRIGKYVKDKAGKITKVNAIPGHNIVIGALGVFILWFGWYGFNGAACTDVDSMAKVFLTTTLAPGVSTCVTMIYTWLKNGKPDVSMTLNGSLAGLVAITAPCACVDAFGAIVIGAVAGVLVVVAVEFVDLKLHVDDPVGAVAVHGANGVWGTLAAGLFSVDTGLFYTGSWTQLGVQTLGVVSILAYTIVVMTIVFLAINKFHGLRVEASEEVGGLDATEHGLTSAYDGFVSSPEAIYNGMKLDGVVQVTTQVPPMQGVGAAAPNDAKITKVDVVCRQFMLEPLKNALTEIGVTGLTVTQVLGCGVQKGAPEYYRGVQMEATLLPKVKVEIVVSKVPVQLVIDTVRKVLYTGHIGDGKVFVYDVENVVKVRTGEQGYDALQDIDSN